MLDFLGLEEEASQLIICMIVAAAVGMIPGGRAIAGENKKNFFMTLCIVVCCIAIVIGLWPAVVLFFTLQWNVLLRGVFFAILAGAATGIPSYAIVKGKRKKKYRENPVMKEVVDYCKGNDIVGIQCYPDGLRFFGDLASEEYCRSDDYTVHTDNSARDVTYTPKPKTWSSTDNDCFLQGTLRFADRGYPNLPDVGMFAQVLAEALGGCAVASHRESTKKDYFQYNQSTGKRELVHLTTYTYQDHFVYKKSALKKLQQRNKQQEKADTARRVAADKNANRWE